MSASAFFDTTILIYAVSEGDRRANSAESLLAGGGTLSVQVLNEFASVARRKLKMPWAHVREVLKDFLTLCGPVVPLTLETHELGLTIAERYAYNIYDSLIVASAIGAGCDVLYSEDMQHGQKIGSLTIRNPFAALSP